MFLLFLCLETANVKAQVRIGGNGAPNAAAVLDLNVDDTNSGAKGLALPRVSLTNVTTPLAGTPVVNGMMVYNTNESVTGGRGIGIYCWNGNKWNAVVGETGIAGTVTGAFATYRTWCFPEYSGVGCWMIDNSREGTPDASGYGTVPVIVAGFYYSLAHAQTACPPGYALPTSAKYNALANFLNAPYGDMVETWHWFGNTACAGFWGATQNEWRLGGLGGKWWTSDGLTVTNQTGTVQVILNEPPSSLLSVRCVKQ